MDKGAFSEILLFKTNISDAADIEKVTSVLASDDRVKKCNIDRHDVDHVLRIESSALCVEEVIQLIAEAGFHCEELPD